MEATGVYWKAPWAILEDEFDCMLVNARHVKQVPGRKTDVSDAAWLCQLAEAGLLKANFVPPKPIRQLRNLTRGLTRGNSGSARFNRRAAPLTTPRAWIAPRESGRALLGYPYENVDVRRGSARGRPSEGDIEGAGD